MKSNIKSKKGFTIIELLVVIVVIGILAAISVVSYSGVTKKANASASAGNAQTVQSAAETFNAALSYFPTATQLTTNVTGSYSKLSAGITVSSTLPTDSNGTKTIGYLEKGSGTAASGACIAYWDYSLSTPAIAYLYAGNATTQTISSGVITACS